MGLWLGSTCESADSNSGAAAWPGSALAATASSSTTAGDAVAPVNEGLLRMG
jgi:hypothetical protein